MVNIGRLRVELAVFLIISLVAFGGFVAFNSEEQSLTGEFRWGRSSWYRPPTYYSSYKPPVQTPTPVYVKPVTPMPISKPNVSVPTTAVKPVEIKLPIGFIDGIDKDNFFNGWTFDPNAPSSMVYLWVYIDEIFLKRTGANFPRPDVNSAYKIAGNHGFKFLIPNKYADGREHTVTVKAEDLMIGSYNSVFSIYYRLTSLPESSPGKRKFLIKPPTPVPQQQVKTAASNICGATKDGKIICSGICGIGRGGEIICSGPCNTGETVYDPCGKLYECSRAKEKRVVASKDWKLGGFMRPAVNVNPQLFCYGAPTSGGMPGGVGISPTISGTQAPVLEKDAKSVALWGQSGHGGATSARDLMAGDQYAYTYPADRVDPRHRWFPSVG